MFKITVYLIYDRHFNLLVFLPSINYDSYKNETTLKSFENKIHIIHPIDWMGLNLNHSKKDATVARRVTIFIQQTDPQVKKKIFFSMVTENH